MKDSTVPPYLSYIDHQLNAYVSHAFKCKRKYIDWFFTLNCSVDLMILDVFPDAKEITETFSAFTAIRKLFKGTQNSNGKTDRPDVNDPSIKVIVIADGSTPRTAAFLAFMTKWTVFSVDPQMKDKWVMQSSVKRLCCIRDKIENVYKDLPPDPTLLILVHPHVNYPTIRSCYPTTPMIVIPCCVDYPRDKATGIYTDHGSWSERNEVFLYRGELCYTKSTKE
jgi:hypothetical protein